MDDHPPERPAEPTLGVLGIDGLDETVYRALLVRREATPADLAEAVDRPAGRVVRVLDGLRQRGLVTRLGGRPRRYVATDPDAALSALIQARGAQLDRVRGLAADLAATFHATRSDAGPDGTVEIIDGRDAVGRWFVRLQQEARHDMLGLDRPPYALAATNPIQPATLDRGVRWRTIYSPEALDLPGALDEVRELAARGERARVLAGLPVKLAVADRRVALIPLHFDVVTMRALVIHRSALLDALLDLFEFYWERAAPLDPTAGEDTVPGEDRDLLTLLVSGLKDDAIARQLGLSTRTMRRRMRRLLDLLGAANRFQAGVAAARRGWL